MIEVRNPANQFFDKNGDPLDAGYIYIGATGVNPEVTAQAIYWDKDGLIPAAQPIRTINGYPSRDGAASKFYTNTKNYSITVRNKRGELVISTLNTDSGVFDELSAQTGASQVGISTAYWTGSGADNVEEAIQLLDGAIQVLEADSTVNSAIPPVLNLFANPAFLVNQRGYVSGTATAAANQYTLDRIRVVVSGQSITWVASSTFGNLITCPAGGAEQVIEGVFITGGQYVCNWGGSGTITINGTSRSKGDEFTLPANTNATIRMFGQIEKMVITRPKMLGVITDENFEYNPVADLHLCRRYYEESAYSEFSGNVNIGDSYYARVSYKTRKRAIPTVTLTNGGASGFPAAGGAVSLSTVDGFTEGRTATGTGVGRFYSTWKASAEL